MGLNAYMAYYRELFVWQKAFKTAKDIFALSSTFPPDQRYRLCDQIERAAISIMSNIAEGSRRTPREWRNYVRIALGSVSELESQLLLSRDLNFGSKNLHDPIFKQLTEISKILNSILIKSQCKKIQP